MSYDLKCKLYLTLIPVIVAIMMLISTVSHAADVSFSWWPNPVVDKVTKYRIHYGTASKTYTEVFEAGLPPVTADGRAHATVTGIAQGVQYFFAATAVNATGESAFSNEVTYTILGLPSVPDGFMLIITGGTPMTGPTK